MTFWKILVAFVTLHIRHTKYLSVSRNRPSQTCSGNDLNLSFVTSKINISTSIKHFFVSFWTTPWLRIPVDAMTSSQNVSIVYDWTTAIMPWRAPQRYGVRKIFDIGIDASSDCINYDTKILNLDDEKYIFEVCVYRLLQKWQQEKWLVVIYISWLRFVRKYFSKKSLFTSSNILVIFYFLNSATRAWKLLFSGLAYNLNFFLFSLLYF